MAEPPVFNRISIVGLGLMGGSLGMALRRKGLAAEVIGYARNPQTGEEALRRGAVDQMAGDLHEAAAADLVVLAVPVGQLLPVLEMMAPGLSLGTVVTDLGSVKGWVVQAADSLPPGVELIGGHPMTGSERGGIGAADPFLYDGAPYVLVPTPRTSEESLHNLRQLVDSLGARPIVLPAQVHDRLVATVSHLPHLAAAMLVNAGRSLEGDLPEALTLVGGGFRDATRMAAGDPRLWRDILAANQGAISNGLAFWQAETARWQKLFATGDWDGLEAELGKARETRRKMPQRPSWQPLAELVAVIDDRPGALGRICTTLGQAGVNIADLRLLRIEPGTGGTLWMGFATPAQRAAAAAALGAGGYKLLEGN